MKGFTPQYYLNGDSMIEASFRIHPGVNAIVSTKVDANNGVGEIGISVAGEVKHLKFLLQSDAGAQLTPSFTESELVGLIGRTVSDACELCSATKGFHVRYISLPRDQGYSGLRWPYNELTAIVLAWRARKVIGRMIA